jgi:hypothetical protein
MLGYPVKETLSTTWEDFEELAEELDPSTKQSHLRVNS